MGWRNVVPLVRLEETDDGRMRYVETGLRLRVRGMLICRAFCACYSLMGRTFALILN